MIRQVFEKINLRNSFTTILILKNNTPLTPLKEGILLLNSPFEGG
jgi:hypothetical protein